MLVLAHRKRVAELSVLLPDQIFQNVGVENQRQFYEYLLIHDLPKVLSIEQLRVLGYDDPRPIYERLADYYRQRLGDLSDVDQRKLKEVIRSLNQL